MQFAIHYKTPTALRVESGCCSTALGHRSSLQKQAKPLKKANKVPLVGGHHTASPLSFYPSLPNIDAFPQPPPAHMGIPPVHIDPRTGRITSWMDFDIPGIPRPPMYPIPGYGQYSPHPVFPDFAQQLQWHTPAMYPMASGAFRGPYPGLGSVPTSGFPAFPRPPLIAPHPSLSGHPGLTHSLLAASAGSKQHQDLAAAVAAATAGINSMNSHSHHSHSAHCTDNNINSGSGASNSRHSLPPYSHSSSHHNFDQKPSLSRISNGSSTTGTSTGSSGGGGVRSPPNSTNSANHSLSSPGTPDSFNGKISKHSKDKPHVKKPLNSFMLYMKEMRPKVVAECTLKESAAINQILGKRWHALTREEQAKYYDMARKERQLHMQLYPGWTARDNYAANAKKKKKKRDKNSDGEGGALKKCRARFGLDQQNNWCKPCRRKKKCIRYKDGDTAGESEDNIGSVDSIEAPTPDSKSANESDADNMTLSSTELSLSSPPVPNSDYILPHSHHNLPLMHQIHNDINSRVQMPTLASPSPLPSCPPRNSPFSIEQLARPHCPQVRSSSSSSISSVNNRSKTPLMTTSSSDSISVPQLPTPPSSEASTPAMLSVA
ncbi:unnamed protein product [Oppiella nova]|uniref:dTCF n=1 Tax=Oppiella nova TaxID=334625 RepID=A0A7R9LA76_9ACAR|nr:unnamed protein product [Oppiella nova]CAG2158843.1 unnamed protein product [Oppiella nova]